MNIIKLLIIVFLYISVLFTSCITKARFYTPNRNPLPMFKNKGDVYIDLSTNMFTKIDITAGYAIIDGLGVYAGYGGARINETTEKSASSSTITYHGKMSNFGIGYFLSEKKSERLRFEIFGDMAMGSYKNQMEYQLFNSNNPIKTSYFNGDFKRIGFLTNIGYSSFKGFLTYGYSLRLSNISFSNAHLGDSAFLQYDLQRLNHKPNYQLLENAVFCKIGKGNIKGQIQIALYHGLNANPNIDAVLKFNGALMIGLVINPNIFTFFKNNKFEWD